MALAAIKREQTLVELAHQFVVRLNLIAQWKAQWRERFASSSRPA